MKDLKFIKKEETQISKSFDKTNIFTGPHKFSTQTTCVYDSFALVLTETEIMKIKTKCEKIFYNNKKIGILSSKKLAIYENNLLINTLDLVNDSNILDFPLDQNLIIDTDVIFMVKNEKLLVSPTTITLNGNSYNNEIHDDNCNYFLAYYDNVAVLGNDKSLSFMYFLNGKIQEVDEYKPLSLRFDEESFDSVYLTDLKFFGSDLMLIDSEIVSHYDIEGLETAHLSLELKEYEINENKIVPVSCTGNEVNEVINSVSESNKENEQADLKIADSDFEALSANEAANLQELTGKEDLKDAIVEPALNPEVKSGINSTTSNIFDLNKVKNESSNIFDLGKNKTPFETSSAFNKSAATPIAKNSGESSSIFNFSNSMSTMKSDLNKPEIKNNSSSSAPSAFDFGKSDFKSSFAAPNSTIIKDNTKSSPTNLPAIHDLNKTPSSLFNNKEKEIDPAILKFDLDNLARITKLSSQFKSIESKFRPIPSLDFSPSSFDIDGLYNLIFHNQFVEYEEALSSMIVQAEQLQSVDSNNIKESIKFFDMKIFEKRAFKRPAKYNNPLCSRFSEVVSISNPVDDIIQGIKVLQVNDQNSKITISSSKPLEISNKDKIVETPAPIALNVPLAVQNTPKPPATFNLTQVPPAPLSVPQVPVQQFNQNATRPSPLFANPTNVSNSFVVNDTSSLFSSLASNPMAGDLSRNYSAPSINPTPAPGPTDAPATGGSAFNRLAGSRKLFQ